MHRNSWSVCRNSVLLVNTWELQVNTWVLLVNTWELQSVTGVHHLQFEQQLTSQSFFGQQPVTSHTSASPSLYLSLSISISVSLSPSLSASLSQSLSLGVHLSISAFLSISLTLSLTERHQLQGSLRSPPLRNSTPKSARLAPIDLTPCTTGQLVGTTGQLAGITGQLVGITGQLLGTIGQIGANDWSIHRKHYSGAHRERIRE